MYITKPNTNLVWQDITSDLVIRSEFSVANFKIKKNNITKNLMIRGIFTGITVAANYYIKIGDIVMPELAYPGYIIPAVVYNSAGNPRGLAMFMFTLAGELHLVTSVNIVSTDSVRAANTYIV